MAQVLDPRSRVVRASGRLESEFDMNTGMLWFDNDPKTALTVKIERAVDYYRKKYGKDPNLCLIHPKELDSAEKGKTRKSVKMARGVTVRPYRPVLPGHLWIGVEDKN